MDLSLDLGQMLLGEGFARFRVGDPAGGGEVQDQPRRAGLRRGEDQPAVVESQAVADEVGEQFEQFALLSRS
ncbi:hypothetical protein [Actinacidiphila oryziradicis]|uniref:Uncharacterized protein n=1 Tax=Actinacidiphila oryziradicis TaxID=2571141 RepID=A0A4U0RV94_9ACTN|nr:hypothetical protein [Actinacidiphila oryziradicis]TKA00110.1 hypothetical protein FCI23_43570 [Actinacidiphila oryziradicis]